MAPQPWVEPSIRPYSSSSVVTPSRPEASRRRRWTGRRRRHAQDLDGHNQPDNAKDDVDEEDRAPGQTEHVGADEETGQDRAADTGETENRAEQPERLGEHVAVECFRHDRHALWD
jgi:hypothetical protein